MIIFFIFTEMIDLKFEKERTLYFHQLWDIRISCFTFLLNFWATESACVKAGIKSILSYVSQCAEREKNKEV